MGKGSAVYRGQFDYYISQYDSICLHFIVYIYDSIELTEGRGEVTSAKDHEAHGRRIGGGVCKGCVPTNIQPLPKCP